MNRIAIAALVSTLALAGTAGASPQSESAWLTQIAGGSVQCFDNTAAYKAVGATVIPSGAFWENSATAPKGLIGLTPWICKWLNRAHQDDAGPSEDTAVFQFSHEMAHASGADFRYERAHATDPVFTAQTAAVAASYPTVNAAREAAADCVGLHNATVVARKIGMEQWAFNASDVRWIATNDGYTQIPAECR